MFSYTLPLMSVMCRNMSSPTTLSGGIRNALLN